MQTDALLQLSDAQSLNGISTRTLSTNLLDMLGTDAPRNLQIARGIGSGKQVYMHVHFITAPTGAAAVTLDVQLLAMAKTTLGASGVDPTTTIDATSAAVISTANDTITIADHGLTAGQPLFLTGGTLPGVTIGEVYFVRNPTQNTFQLSATPGGAAVNITALGTGAPVITFIPTYLCRSGGIPVRRLKAGSQLVLPIAPSTLGPLQGRYLQAAFLPSGALTGGSVDVFLTESAPQENIYYPPSYSIS